MDLHSFRSEIHPANSSEEASALRVVCGWCGTVLRDSKCGNGLTSHGMCSACVERFEADVLTDADGTVVRDTHDIRYGR